MKKILFILLLVFTMTFLAMTSQTYAYTYDVGLNTPNVYPFLDEFTYDSGTTDTIYWNKVSALTEPSYSIVFLDTTPILGDDENFNLLLGAYFDDIETITIYDEQVYYYQLNAYSNIELANRIFYIDNIVYLDEPNLLGIKIEGNGLTRTFIETYAYIIYDTPENIINRTINYYSNIATGIGFDEGYEEGLLDADTSGSAVITQYYYDGGFADARELYGDYDGTEWLTFDDGYDIGYSYGTSATVNQSQINFYDDFEKWIVPAILLVILLGGFTTIYVQKRRGE